MPLAKPATYYDQLAQTAEGYVSDPAERERQVAIMCGRQHEVEELAALVNEPK